MKRWSSTTQSPCQAIRRKRWFRRPQHWGVPWDTMGCHRMPWDDMRCHGMPAVKKATVDVNVAGIGNSDWNLPIKWHIKKSTACRFQMANDASKKFPRWVFVSTIKYTHTHIFGKPKGVSSIHFRIAYAECVSFAKKRSQSIFRKRSGTHQRRHDQVLGGDV